MMLAEAMAAEKLVTEVAADEDIINQKNQNSVVLIFLSPIIFSSSIINSLSLF